MRSLLILLAWASLGHAETFHTLVPSQQPFQKPYQKSLRQAATSQALQLNVVYPPNLVQPGSTAYTSYQAGVFQPLDPNLVARFYSDRAQQAMQGLDVTTTQGLAMTQSLAASIGSVATVNAATEHLRAAQGSGAAAVQALTQSITLKSDGRGGWQVVKEQGATSAAPRSTTASVLDSKCASCHGPGKASPDGGVFLHSGANVDYELAGKALDQVRQDKMPKGGPPLTDQEKAKVMAELLDLAGR